MKKVIKVIFNVIAWIVLIFALLITLLVFSSDRNNDVATLLGYIPLTVESNSMKPTFEKDDLIIDKEIDDINDLKVGDVITYWTIIDGEKVKNTHRIVEINDVNGSKNFVTRGDNNDADDDISVYPVDIIGKWTGTKLDGFGKAMDFLRTKKGFFICILIPMALFFLFELYKLIATVVEVRNPVMSEEDEEEIKRRAVEEYLKEQQEKAAKELEKAGAEKDGDGENKDTFPDEEKPDEPQKTDDGGSTDDDDDKKKDDGEEELAEKAPEAVEAPAEPTGDSADSGDGGENTAESADSGKPEAAEASVEPQSDTENDTDGTEEAADSADESEDGTEEAGETEDSESTDEKQEEKEE